MSDPQPSFQPNPGQFQPPQPQRRGLPTWAIVLIAVFGGTAVLCVIISIVGYLALNVMSSRVSTVFNRISNELEASSSETNDPAVFSTAAPVSTNGARALNEPITVGDLEITVQSASPVTPAEDDLPPAEGKTYLGVQVAVRNTGLTEAYLAAFDTRVQDGAGGVSEVSLFGQSAKQQNLFQTIEPGKTLNTTFIYEVDDSAAELFWIYTDANEARAVVKVK